MKRFWIKSGICALVVMMAMVSVGCDNGGGGGGAHQITTTINTDVVVVGGGGGGFTTALAATRGGLDVILVEQLAFTGGNTILAGGAMNAPGGPFQAAMDTWTTSDRGMVLYAINFDPDRDIDATLFGGYYQYNNFNRDRSRSDAFLAFLQEGLERDWNAWTEVIGGPFFDSKYLHMFHTWYGGDFLADPRWVEIIYGGCGADLFPNNPVPFVHLEAVRGRGRPYAIVRWLSTPIEQGGLGGFHHHQTQIVGSLWPRSQWVNLGGSVANPGSTGQPGVGFIRLQEYAFRRETPAGSVLLEHRAEEIIMLGGRAVGIRGSYPGGRFEITAERGVVIATGGFCGNPTMLERYNIEAEQLPLAPGMPAGVKWPDLRGFNTTNLVPAATGLGILMAQAAGAAVIDMDQVQFLPGGAPAQPTQIIGGGGDTLTPGVNNSMWLDMRGYRAVNETGRRDALTVAGLVAREHGSWRNISGPGVANTPGNIGVLGDAYDCPVLALEVAEAFLTVTGRPAPTQQEIDAFAANFIIMIRDYNYSFRESIPDRAGKTVKDWEIVPPFRIGAFTAMPALPNLHHTMGGLLVDPPTGQVQSTAGGAIPGLYAVGEVVGNIHGTNRLGGNAITDIVVYGKVLGNRLATVSR